LLMDSVGVCLEGCGKSEGGQSERFNGGLRVIQSGREERSTPGYSTGPNCGHVVTLDANGPG